MMQFIRFLLVGVFNTGLGYCVIFGCMYLAGFSAELSNALGYGVGLIVSYFLNRNFTFKSVQDRRTEMIRFVGVFLIAYAANFIVLTTLIHKLDVHPGISQVVAGVIYVAASYFMNKYYVFRSAMQRTRT